MFQKASEERMKIILTFTLLMIPGALSFSVTGYSGGRLTITCKYDKEYTTNEKYFCKGQMAFIRYPGWCSDLIRTDIKDKWFQKETFSLYDNTIASVFTVTITDLKIKDSDTYQCAVYRAGWIDIVTEVKLTVKEDHCCKKIISLSVTSGESVNISCKYPQSHRSDVKFFCRRSGADICAHETSVKESRRWTTDREFLLYDDRNQDLLYVTITNVTDHRSAEYWCGVQTDVKIFITRVQITVTGTSKHKTTTPPPPLSLLSSTTTTSSSLLFSSNQSKLNISSSTSSLSFCKSTLVASPSSVTSSDPLFIGLSVVLIIGLLLLILCKRHKTSASDSTIKGSADQDSRPENNERVSRASCDCTEIKDIRGDVIYSTAELPTNTYDAPNSLYAAAQLPTIPSDSCNTVYAAAQLPTNFFDS